MEYSKSWAWGRPVQDLDSRSVYVVGSGFADFESRVGVLFCRFWENNVNTKVMKWHGKK